jgi:hypothetical protein
MAKHLATLLSLALALAAVACAHAPVSGVTEAGARVDIGKGDPSKEMIELGAFEAVDPPACPTDGKPGTYEGALVSLRNTAGRVGADYVQIFRSDMDSCQRYVLRAMAYKNPAN